MTKQTSKRDGHSGPCRMGAPCANCNAISEEILARYRVEMDEVLLDTRVHILNHDKAQA